MTTKGKRRGAARFDWNIKGTKFCDLTRVQFARQSGRGSSERSDDGTTAIGKANKSQGRPWLLRGRPWLSLAFGVAGSQEKPMKAKVCKKGPPPFGGQKGSMQEAVDARWDRY